MKLLIFRNGLIRNTRERSNWAEGKDFTYNARDAILTTEDIKSMINILNRAHLYDDMILDFQNNPRRHFQDKYLGIGVHWISIKDPSAHYMIRYGTIYRTFENNVLAIKSYLDDILFKPEPNAKMERVLFDNERFIFDFDAQYWYNNRGNYTNQYLMRKE